MIAIRPALLFSQMSPKWRCFFKANTVNEEDPERDRAEE